MTAVDAAQGPQIVHRTRSLLGDSHDAEIGQHLAHRNIEVGGPAFPPCGDRGRHHLRLSAQPPGLLDPCHGLIGRAPVAGSRQQQRTLLLDPVGTIEGRQLRPQAVDEREQELDVGGGVAKLIVGEGAPEPVGEPVTLRQVEPEIAIQQ